MRFRIAILMVTLTGVPMMASGQQPADGKAKNSPAADFVPVDASGQPDGVWSFELATPANAKLLTWSRYLGADLAAADAPLRSQLKLNDGEGFVVTAVTPDGAAAEGGLVLYDVVVGLNDDPKPEAAYPLYIWRAGAKQPMTIKTKPDRKGWIGVNLAEIDEAMRSQLSLPAGRGLLVQEVTDDSPASQAGVQKFDVIDGFGDGAPSGTVEAFSAIVQKSAGKTLSVQILRHGKSLTINLTPKKRPAEETGVWAGVPQTQARWLMLNNLNQPAWAAARNNRALNYVEFLNSANLANLARSRNVALNPTAGDDRQTKLAHVEKQLDQLLKELQATREALEEIRKLEDKPKEKK